MESFQARRSIGGGLPARVDPQQQSPFWYPPPSSSSPHLAHRPLPSFPPYPHPSPQQQQQWANPDARHHQLAPPPPPPYHAHPPVSPLPPPHHYPPAPAHQLHRPHHGLLPPHHGHPLLPSSAYLPPPNQGWGNPSWAQHQGLEYPERNLPYNNEEDWAARAKAWAAAKSSTENHHLPPQFMPVGRMEEHSFAYDQYQLAAGPSTNFQQPPLPQSSNQQLSIHLMEQQKQVNNLHGSASFCSESSSYGTEGRQSYNAGEEAIGAAKDLMVSPQGNFGPISSIYEQEVPYSYSSTPGGREALNQSESLQVPLPLPVSSVQEACLQQHSTMPIRHVSLEQPHFIHGGQSSKLMTDASDQPLDFVPRPASDHEPHQKISYGPSDPVGSVGVMDHDAAATSIAAWTPSAAPGVFSHIPLAQSVTQLDSSFASQPSLPVHPAPAFGRIPGPSFRPSIPPVSASFGLGIPTSLHTPGTFSGDANGAFTLPERPKKAAVPNWLREEIIKNKSVLASTVPTNQTSGLFHSMGSEDDESFRRIGQSDRKSVDRTKSTEEDEDDEDEVEAARSAAINQEIKRVLTEVLLKVTDELFDEIATKVLNEDDLPMEVSEHTDPGYDKVSHPSVSTTKASAKVLVPVKKDKNKVDGVGEDSSPSSPGGDILGLANYASDDDDNGAQSNNLLSSGEIVGASHQQGTNGRSSESVIKKLEKGNELVHKREASGGRDNNDIKRNRTDINGAPLNRTVTNEEGSSVMQNASLSGNNFNSHENAPKEMSGTGEEKVSFDREVVCNLASSHVHHSMDTAGKKESRILESTGEDARKGKPFIKENNTRESKSISSINRQPAKRSSTEDSIEEVNASTYKTGASDPISKEDRKKKDEIEKREKSEKRINLKEKERAQVRSMKGGINRESDSGSSSRQGSVKEERRNAAKDKREREREDGERKKERIRDEKEDRAARVTKESVRHSTRRSSSPSSRGRKSKENSLYGHGSVSTDDPSENSKKRKLQSHRGSLSPSPTRSRTRQVSRSPHSKHSHRRHSPYSSLDRRRRRSRSSTPVHRRR